jgi:hypothetical protein
VKAQADVWPTEKQWSPEMEDQFSAWVESSWDDEIFMRPESELYGLETDCADASYTMRAYFAYLNHLPFKVINPGKGGGFFTNQMKNFDKYLYPHDRLIAFLKLVLDVVDSGSLANDTYPIAINRNFMRAGAIYVTPNTHTYQIKRVNENGVPTLYSSTVPQAMRYLLILESFPLYMPTDFKNHRDGFRMFKQPQQYGMAESSLPGYSLQQFEISKSVNENILDFGDEVSRLLAYRPETVEEKTKRTALNLCNTAEDRAVEITKAINFKNLKGFACFSASEYENYSTPGRDHKLKMMFDYAQRVHSDPDFKRNYTFYSEVLDSIFDSRVSVERTLAWCPMNRYTGFADPLISLRDIYQSIQSNSLVSDPNANAKQRWGLEPYTPVCKQY